MQSSLVEEPITVNNHKLCSDNVHHFELDQDLTNETLEGSHDFNEMKTTEMIHKIMQDD